MSVEERLSNIESMLGLLLKQQANPDTNDEVAIQAAAELVGMTVKTMYNYVNCGKLAIPYIKRGGRIYWKRADLLAWQAERSYKVVRKNGTKMEIAL